jgi:hypothetical protein
MVVSVKVLIILSLSITQALKTRLFNFCGWREQDAPETLPSQPPKRWGMPMVHGTPPSSVRVEERMWGREGDATYTSSYCECGRQSPGGAQRSEERAEWSTRAAG